MHCVGAGMPIFHRLDQRFLKVRSSAMGNSPLIATGVESRSSTCWFCRAWRAVGGLLQRPHCG